MPPRKRQGRLSLNMKVMKMVDTTIDAEDSPLIRLGVFIVLTGVAAVLYSVAYYIVGAL